MSPITTHVLDTAKGKPAHGVPVVLELKTGPGWKELGRGTTDGDGRLKNLLPEGTALSNGTYRLIFDTGAYHKGAGTQTFYPEVAVCFEVRDSKHHHVPLLLSPFGYSTYRGS